MLPNARDRRIPALRSFLGHAPLFYRSELSERRPRPLRVPVVHLYLDVSGSMTACLPYLSSEDETFDKILALAGESLDELFESRHYLKPIADFRDEVAAALPRRAATQLIERCQVECSPRVSVETAETKTRER